MPTSASLAKTVGVLSPGVGRSEECAHIHSGLNQQDLDLISSDVFLAHSDWYGDGRWWFESSRLISASVSEGTSLYEVGFRELCCCLYQSV